MDINMRKNQRPDVPGTALFRPGLYESGPGLHGWKLKPIGLSNLKRAQYV